MKKNRIIEESEDTRSLRRGGFSLLEMLVAIGIFSIIMLVAIGIMINVVAIQHKSVALQQIQDNARFSLELMTKEMRTGHDFTLTTICNPSSGQEIKFISTSAESGTKERAYFLWGEKIYRFIGALAAVNCFSDPSTDAKQFTSDDVKVDSLHFDLRGASGGSNQCLGQPLITIAIKLHGADVRYGSDSVMNLQATVAQRLRGISSGIPPCP